MIGWILNDFYSPNKMHYNLYEACFTLGETLFEYWTECII